MPGLAQQGPCERGGDTAGGDVASEYRQLRGKKGGVGGLGMAPGGGDLQGSHQELEEDSGGTPCGMWGKAGRGRGCREPGIRTRLSQRSQAQGPSLEWS